MKCNVGGIDRMGRFIIGIILVLLGFLAPMNATWQVVVFVLAAIALITAIFRFCPLNALIGINTCKRKEQT